MEFTAETIAAFLSGQIVGDKDVKVNNVAKIEEATPGTLAFLANPKYEEYIYTTGASIVLVNDDFEPREQVKATLVKVENAYKSFASLLDLYMSAKPQKSGINSLAVIPESCKLEENESCYIGEYVVLGENVKIGKNAKIYPQVYLGDNIVVGDNVTIYAGVKVYEGCVLGNNVTLHSGVVVGGDGFGFAPTEDGHFQKIQQIGNVVIEDDVEIGANTCIDRATMGSTVIKQGVKLDNLIQVAHNVVIGEDTVIAAQAGIAGSTKIGRNVMIGGQVGIVGHLTIADQVKISSQSGINHNIDKVGEVLLGSPAINGLAHHRSHAIFKQLPDLRNKVLTLEKELKKLREELSK